ncbi:MAG: hypothetical protein V1743_06170 [Nanoarchaeota archaeon]
MANTVYYCYRGLSVNTGIHEGKIPELEKILPFLRDFLDDLPKDATLERITVASIADMSEPAKNFSEDEYMQTCDVKRFGVAVVHTYWSKDYLSGENSTPQHTIIIYIDPHSKALKTEKLYSLRTKYPFLEQILQQESYPLFDIAEAVADDSVLAEKCQDHDSQGPEAFDSSFYSVTKNRVKELAVFVVDALMQEQRAIEPSPTVREELAQRGITPDFLVKRHHLKYEVNGEHSHDVTLTVYRV